MGSLAVISGKKVTSFLALGPASVQKGVRQDLQSGQGSVRLGNIPERWLGDTSGISGNNFEGTWLHLGVTKLHLPTLKVIFPVILAFFSFLLWTYAIYMCKNSLSVNPLQLQAEPLQEVVVQSPLIMRQG